MVVDGTAQLLHLERPTLRRHPGAPLPEMGDEAEQRAKEDESLHVFTIFFLHVLFSITFPAAGNARRFRFLCPMATGQQKPAVFTAVAHSGLCMLN